MIVTVMVIWFTLICCPTCLGPSPKRGNDKRSSSSLSKRWMSYLNVKRGDCVVTSVFGGDVLWRPYHWTFAWSEIYLLSIRETKPGIAVPEWIDRLKYPETRAKILCPTPPSKVQPLGEASFTLAQRIAGIELPYSLLWCNCRHYLDYIMYGRTFGRKWTLTNLPISKTCPLHRIIDSRTTVNDPSFKLMDYYKKEYELWDLSKFQKLSRLETQDSIQY